VAGKKGELVKQFRCMDCIVGETEYFISHGNNCSSDCDYCEYRVAVGEVLKPNQTMLDFYKSRKKLL
jgi:2-iminoacetate synthase ThiH